MGKTLVLTKRNGTGKKTGKTLILTKKPPRKVPLSTVAMRSNRRRMA